VRRGRPPYPDVLTPREWEVLSLIREGLTNDQIAERLGISGSGARFHVAEILSKLGVPSRHDAARWSEAAPVQRRSGFSALGLSLGPWKKGAVVQFTRAAGVAILSSAGIAMVLLAVGVLANDGRPTPTPIEETAEESPAPEVDPNQPTAYGPYRLLPPGFVRGVFTSQNQALPWPAGVANASPEELRRSPLFIAVEGVPDDMRLLHVHSNDATSGYMVVQEFRTSDGQRSVTVTRGFVARRPIEVNLPAVGGSVLMSKERVLSVEALVLRRSPDSPLPVYTHVRFVDAEVETSVEGTRVPEDLVIRIAENVLRSSRGE
jgi:DNA-binding CsgD family transcriptional regulator